MMFLVVKEMRLKGLLDNHFLDKSVVENSDYNEEDDIVNHGRKSHTHQNPYMRHRQGESLVVNFSQISISANGEILMIMMI